MGSCCFVYLIDKRQLQCVCKESSNVLCIQPCIPFFGFGRKVRWQNRHLHRIVKLTDEPQLQRGAPVRVLLVLPLWDNLLGNHGQITVGRL